MSYCLPSTALDTDAFPNDYAGARQHWLSKTAGLPFSGRYLSYACTGRGSKGEELATDTLWLGPDDAQNVLVLIGGTHGIEGYTGSAVQLDLLHLLTIQAIAAPNNTAILLIHALTPWGYSWQRRCDENGIDLNRNIVDFSAPLPENAGYSAINEALFLTNAVERNKILLDFERQFGRAELEKAVSAGQYIDPAGPFYGGNAPAHGRTVCESLFDEYALFERNLSVIDLHTGLGPFGYGEIICDHQPDSAGARTAQSWYGDSVALPWLGTSSSVPKLGLLDYAWHAIMNDRSCYVTLEFGTYGTDPLFETLLIDHQLWAQSGNIETRKMHGRIMRRHFCPDDRAWREMVLFRARQVIMQALSGLSG